VSAEALREPETGAQPHKKKRWLLWLEDTSQDASRRAAAHRTPISKLKTKIPCAARAIAAPPRTSTPNVHTFEAQAKDYLEYRNSRASGS
jgi:hypothetical protein